MSLNPTSSNRGSIEHTTHLAQGQLYLRFVLTLILCFVVIQVIVTALLIYQQHFQAKQMMTSLKVEYQRFLVFESSEKLEHVLTSSPDKLLDNSMGVMRLDESTLSHVAGLEFNNSNILLEQYLTSDTDWIDFLLGQPYLTIKLNAEKKVLTDTSESEYKSTVPIYWLVLDVPTKLAALVEKWVLIAAVLILLSILISVVVWRLLHATLQPLHVLAKGLDDHQNGHQAWQQEEIISDKDSHGIQRKPKSRSKGLEALNQGVNQSMMRLKSANLSMSHTLDAIAHDLRTPLSRILLSSEKVLGTQSEQKNENLLIALSDCAESASQASQLLMTLMKINDEVIGRHDIVKESVSLKGLASTVMSWYEEIAEEKGIKLILDQLDDVTWETDPKRLTQILVNLVDNSIKYSEKGDEIRMTWGIKGQECYLSVVDTGIGIDQVNQQAIFERLYRVDHSRSQAGYGLGLAMVKVMLDSLGASIDVTSALGEGSKFSISLPK